MNSISPSLVRVQVARKSPLTGARIRFVDDDVLLLHARIVELEAQQAPAAQHDEGVQAAAERSALVVDVGREWGGQFQPFAVPGGRLQLHRAGERDVFVQEAGEFGGLAHRRIS